MVDAWSWLKLKCIENLKSYSILAFHGQVCFVGELWMSYREWTVFFVNVDDRSISS